MNPTPGDDWTLVIEAVPASPRARSAVVRALGLAMGLSLGETESLVAALPFALPVALSEAQAQALAHTLAENQARCALTQELRPRAGKCLQHRGLISGQPCAQCARAICVACVGAAAGMPLCAACFARAHLKQRFFRGRVVVWSMMLAAVVIWAAIDVTARWSRKQWRRPLTVALVIVARGPVAQPELDALVAGVPRLALRLQSEFERYRGTRGSSPVSLQVLGPVRDQHAPPALRGRDLWERWQDSRRLSMYLQPLDIAAHVRASAYDSRVYLVAAPAQGAQSPAVEGIAEAGGRVGLVQVELGPDMVDFALTVVAHELLHTVGATDKYDLRGQPVFPDGFAAPEQVPPYPQAFFEVMARGRPLDPQHSAAPDNLDHLRVGEQTAREVGWLRHP